MKNKPSPEFDQISSQGYQELLDDPLRSSLGGDQAYFDQRKVDHMTDTLLGADTCTGDPKHLDVGCGEGRVLELLRQGFEGQFYGVDVSRGMLKTLSISGTALFDGQCLPFPDDCFDSMSMACVMHHVKPEDRSVLLKECARVLKPKGALYVFEHNPYNPLTRWIVARTPVDADAQLLTASELRNLGQPYFSQRCSNYYLFFPSKCYAILGGLEKMMGSLPLGGQYCVKLSKA